MFRFVRRILLYAGAGKDDCNEAKIFVGNAYLADLIENEFITRLRSLFINKCPLMTKLGVSGSRNR